MKNIFKALSDPDRIKILQIIKYEKKNVGDILKHFDFSGATLSYHLNILKKSGLIRESKEKNFIYYETNYSVFEEIIVFLNTLKEKNKNEVK